MVALTLSEGELKVFLLGPAVVNSFLWVASLEMIVMEFLYILGPNNLRRLYVV